MRRRTTPLLVVLIALALAAATPRATAEDETPADSDPPVATTNPAADEVVVREKRLQDVVDDLRTQLSIADAVVVSIVPQNQLVVSVERAKGGAAGFTLSVEDDFVRRLSDDEVGAVMAHELGHVWIYTHHPFLQTEELANEIAMRVVSRELLESLYKKVWERTGGKGTLTYLPGL